MASQKLIRWSAIAWVLSALTGIIPTLLGPSDFAQNGVLGSLWVPMRALLTVSYLLFPFGLIGIYVLQADRAGRLGDAAFLLSFFGTSYLVAQAAVAAFVLPQIALQANAPRTAFAMLDPAGPLPTFSSVILLPDVAAALGFVLLGIAIMRAGLLPHWAGLLLIIVTILELGIFVGAPAQFIIKLGDLGLDVTKLWLASALWIQSRTMARQPNPALSTA